MSDKSKALDARLLQLEEVLLQADIGVSTTKTILQVGEISKVF